MLYDVVFLTDSRYVNPKENSDYISNVLLEDQLVLNELKAQGIATKRVAWDDPDFDWRMAKYVVFRAVWDYFERYEEFYPWFKNTIPKTKFINTADLIFGILTNTISLIYSTKG